MLYFFFHFWYYCWYTICSCYSITLQKYINIFSDKGCNLYFLHDSWCTLFYQTFIVNKMKTQYNLHFLWSCFLSRFIRESSWSNSQFWLWVLGLSLLISGITKISIWEGGGFNPCMGMRLPLRGWRPGPGLQSNWENREHRKYFWNVVLKENNQSGVRN